MDFNQTIQENRKTLGRPFIASHRGVCGANIPCNSIAAFTIALNMGADVMEIDVSKSKDGHYFVFHPGTEPTYLDCGRFLSDMTADEIKPLRLLNADKVPTHYHIPTIQEVFALLKDKVYINVDKYWTDIEGITNEIRKAGVEKQVIVKTYDEEGDWDQIEKYAPDLMYMTMAWHTDTITERLKNRNINYIGIEALYDKETDDICSDAYIKWMHDRNLLVWHNSIIYNEKDVISAYHTDDVSLTKNPDLGWGWLINKNVDFIQTDWVLPLKNYMEK